MNASKQLGLVLVIVAVLIGVWVVNRVTGLVGQLHSWRFPLSQYETYTIAGGLAAVVLLLVGMRKLSGKPSEGGKG